MMLSDKDNNDFPRGNQAVNKVTSLLPTAQRKHLELAIMEKMTISAIEGLFKKPSSETTDHTSVSSKQEVIK